MNITTLNMTTLDGNVIIKKGGGGTPTPPSGGGSGNKYVYYDLRNASTEVKAMFLQFGALMIRFDGADMYTIPPLLMAAEGFDETFLNKTLAAMADLDLEIDFGEGLMKVRDMMSMGGLTFPEITKEEFYALTK